MRSVGNRNVIMRRVTCICKIINMRISDVSLVFTIRWKDISVCCTYTETDRERNKVEEVKE